MTIRIPAVSGEDFDSVAEATAILFGEHGEVGVPVSAKNPLPTTSTSGISQPDGTSIMQVGTALSKFTDGFNGSAIDPDKWDIVRNTGGMTRTVANGSLTVGLGTTAGAELLLVGKQVVTSPANVACIFSMSQRLATNDFSFGYLECDPVTGEPIPHATLVAREFRNSVRKSFTTAVVANAGLETMSTDAPAVVTLPEVLATTTATVQDHTIFLRVDDVASSSQISNSTVAKAATGTRISTQVPSPNRVYRPFLHFRTTVAPTSNTNVVIARFYSIDIQELEVQASMGSGNAMPSQAVPIVSTGGNVVVSGAVGLTQTALQIGGTVACINSAVIGLINLPHYRSSTADTNSVLLKNTLGKVMSGRIRNKAAYEVVVKFYNKATAPVVGTDTPFFKLLIPANSVVDLPEVFGPQGLYFTAGIGYGITQLDGDNDVTAVAIGDVSVSLIYV